MIYCIPLKHIRRTDAGFKLYAHPEWPWVIGHDGDPRHDFKVVFIQNPGLVDLEIELFANQSQGIYQRVLLYPSTGYQLEYTWNPEEVELIKDLSKLG